MEMWLKRLTLVLLTGAVGAMVILSQGHVILDETQRVVQVHQGSSLTLRCSLNTEQYNRFRATFHFNPSEPSSQKAKEVFWKIVVKNFTEKMQQTEETYVISNATEKDNGWYWCKVTVEIPILEVKWSNGTQVVITTPPEAPPLLTWWMWILLGVSMFILVFLLVICILLRRRCYRTRAPDPIYSNTHPVTIKQPSPRPKPLDALKVPSSQHLRTPSPSRRQDDGKRRHKL